VDNSFVFEPCYLAGACFGLHPVFCCFSSTVFGL